MLSHVILSESECTWWNPPIFDKNLEPQAQGRQNSSGQRLRAEGEDETLLVILHAGNDCYIAIENGHRNSGFSHWKWWFIVDFPIEHGDFPRQNVSLPEGSTFGRPSLEGHFGR